MISQGHFTFLDFTKWSGNSVLLSFLFDVNNFAAIEIKVD